MYNIMKFKVKLSSYSTLRIGGPAEFFIEADSSDLVADAVDFACQRGLVWRILGHGSNVLISDEGLPGVTIVFRDTALPTIEGDIARVSGGVPLADLVTFLCKRGLGGIEDLAGIPGTVGGATAGNAGAYGTAIGDRVVDATILEEDGTVHEANASELAFSYRHSALKTRPTVVLEARIRTIPAPALQLIARAEKRLADRAQKHPDSKMTPTAGSWFKNIKRGTDPALAAGRLLEEVGCKSLRVGGASVWPRHANILVTDETATSADVRALADEMARRVEEKFGIRLEPEVRYLA